MIYTVTLNPSIDYIIETKEFDINQTNYYHNSYQTIGGKGINVAIVLNNLLAPVIANGIMGNVNKFDFLNEFKFWNLSHNFFYYEGANRINFKIKNLVNKEETEINSIKEKINPWVTDLLIEYLTRNVKENDIVVCAGSINPSLNQALYLQIAEIVKKNKGLLIIDSSKLALKNSLQAKPYLIKPNLQELCNLLDKEVNEEYTFEELKDMVEAVKDMGARNILLSMGKKGSYYFSENKEVYHVSAADGELINSVGAGDSMLAGFIYGLFNKLDIEKTLKYSASAGSATAFTKGLATKAEIENLLDLISVKKIKD